MFKTDALDSVANAYVDENLGTATPGTRLEADDRNIIQDELVNRIEGSGLTLDASGVFTNNDQLHESIKLASGLETIFNSSGTWTKPDGLNFIEVTVVGGGGGGGGIDGQGVGTFGTGKPGGGAGASIKRILASALSASETITIGAGGSGGAAGANSGTDGGTTSFGAHCSATGGGGGLGETASTNLEAYQGKIAGIGSGGDVNISGSPGGISVSVSTDSRGAVSGNGGSSLFSGGIEGRNDGEGRPAVGKGGGGSGAATENSTSDYAGGNGSDGIIIVKEFF